VLGLHNTLVCAKLVDQKAQGIEVYGDVCDYIQKVVYICTKMWWAVHQSSFVKNTMMKERKDQRRKRGKCVYMCIYIYVYICMYYYGGTMCACTHTVVGSKSQKKDIHKNNLYH
jgi:hypothetical protein